MVYRIAADCILLLHLAFTLFTVLGGLLVLRRPSLLWLHLAAVLWGVVIEWADWVCPLTPLENFLRENGGEAGYAGGFIEHYVALLLYPENLTIALRSLLGLGLVATNLIIYGYVFLVRRPAHAHKKAPFPGERRKGAHWCENQGYYFFILAAPLVFMGSPL